MQARRGLTEQEGRVAHLVAVGWTNREIAAELDLSPKTVEWHVTRILRKLGLRSRVELAARIGALADQGSPLGPAAPKDESPGPLSAAIATGIHTTSGWGLRQGGKS